MAETADTAPEHAKRRIAAYKGYKDGLVEFYGNQVEVMTGYTKEELSQEKWTNLIFEEDRPKAKDAFVKALKSDKVYNREYRIKKKNGNLAWIQEWSEILLDDTGDIDCVVGALIDITEDKKIEEARLRAERLTGKYLIFSLAGEEYGFNIFDVREIIGAVPITPLPEAASYLKGVIDLRGKIIPIMDLRLRLGLERAELSKHACIIVVEIPSPGGKVLLGVLTDSVTGVLFIQGTEIDKAPAAFRQYQLDYITGMAKTERGVVVLINMGRMFSEEEVAGLTKSAG